MARELDVIDRKIIRHLTLNGRASGAEISRLIPDVSSRTIQSRIERLFKQNVIRSGACIDLRPIGLQLRANILLVVEPGYLEAVAEKLAQFDLVSYVACTLGQYDVSFTVHSHDTADLYSFISESLSNIPWIKDKTINLLPILLKDPQHWFIPADGEAMDVRDLSDPPIKSSVSVYRIDRIDLEILNMLIRNGRLPAAEIARQLCDISPLSVRSRIEMLIQRDILYAAGIVNPEKVGFPLCADVHIEVEAQRVMEVSRILSQLKRTSHVACAIGGPDVKIQFFARDAKEVYEFVTAVIHKIPGVKRTITLLVCKHVKEYYDYQLPAFLAEEES